MEYRGRKVRAYLNDDGGVFEGFIHSIDSQTGKLSLEKGFSIKKNEHCVLFSDVCRKLIVSFPNVSALTSAGWQFHPTRFAAASQSWRPVSHSLACGSLLVAVSLLLVN